MSTPSPSPSIRPDYGRAVKSDRLLALYIHYLRSAEPLPGRRNLVLTRSAGFRPQGVEIVGDTRFPNCDWNEWRKADRSTHPIDEKHAYTMTFLKLERIAPSDRAQ